MLSAEKRKKIEDLVLGTVKRLEQGTENYDRYKALFKSMNDEEFSEWAEKFNKDNFDQCIQIFCLPFQEPTLKGIKNAADFLGVPLEEYVYFTAPDGSRVRTKTRVPVGYCHIKRLRVKRWIETLIVVGIIRRILPSTL